MKKDYQIASRSDRRALAEFLSKEGQLLLPMLELIEQAELAVDELIDVAGRATIEAVLTLSAQQLAGPKHPGSDLHRRALRAGWIEARDLREPCAPRQRSGRQSQVETRLLR